jgi:nicotinamidase-related amidase
MKVLVVVDMQNDFIDGALGTKEAQAIVPNVKKKIEEYKNLVDGEIVFTQDTHYTNYLLTNEGKNLPVEHCIYGTHGWELREDIHNPYGNIAIHVQKDTFGYLDWKFPIWKDETIERIELVGLCTDICVVSNALILKATYPEIDIIVDASCCAGVTPESHKAALTTMKMCQINVIGE